VCRSQMFRKNSKVTARVFLSFSRFFRVGRKEVRGGLTLIRFPFSKRTGGGKSRELEGQTREGFWR
jgi:hypothetical protein